MPNYPYLPLDRSFKFVSDGHPFMEEAKRARSELAGDSTGQTGRCL